jgi:hypothetical protein
MRVLMLAVLLAIGSWVGILLDGELSARGRRGCVARVSATGVVAADGAAAGIVASTAEWREVIAIGTLLAIARMSARTWAAAAPRGASTFAHAALRVMGDVGGSRAEVAGGAPLRKNALSLSSGRDVRGGKRDTGVRTALGEPIAQRAYAQCEMLQCA